MANDDLPSKMKACRVTEFKKPYKVEDVATPSPDKLHPKDLLIKVAVGSYCHTDNMVSDGIMGTPLPCIASHEGAGTVVALGKDVQDWKVGDRCMVALKTHLCGKCISCNMPEDKKHYCPNGGAIPGVTGDGAFAEYMVADSEQSSKIPDQITFETAAPLACAGRTVYRGVEQARLKSGQWIGLVGSGGGLGHLGIQFAKAKGLKIVAVDARDEGIEMSKEMGADVVLDAREGKEVVVKKAMEATAGRGCDATVNLSDADSAAALSAAITAMHHHVVQIAQPEEVKVPYAEFVFRDVRFEGSLVCGRKQSDEMLQIVAKHGITVTTNSVKGVDNVPKLVEMSHSGKLKGKGIALIDEAAIAKQKELGAKY